MSAVRAVPSLSLLLLAIACSNTTAPSGGGNAALAAPTGISYLVEASGDPTRPAGVLVTWDRPSDPLVRGWNVYSRVSTGDAFALRAATTSPSFDERGLPDLQYYVVATDAAGREGPPSATVTVDERLALPRPATLTSTSLDGKIALFWSDNAYTSNPNAFKQYRVYSTTYNLDANVCGTDWGLEGTTVAPEFVAGALTNGSPRCFATSAVSVEGFESLWSPIRQDTPRFEARNVVLTAFSVTPATSGFRFFRDLNGDRVAQRAELGRVEAGTVADLDLRLERDPSGTLFLVPIRAGVSIAPYGTGPVADLTSIDAAPTAGYATSPLEAKAGYAYVVQMPGPGGDTFARFGAIRVTNVGRDLVTLDWAYQTDPGNPELLLGGTGSL